MNDQQSYAVFRVVLQLTPSMAEQEEAWKNYMLYYNMGKEYLAGFVVHELNRLTGYKTAEVADLQANRAQRRRSRA